MENRDFRLKARLLLLSRYFTDPEQAALLEFLGLALSKGAHWMFDAGLWTVDNDQHVVVNLARFTEAGPEALQLRAAAGRHLQFAPKAKLRPSPECLRRHRLRFG